MRHTIVTYKVKPEHAEQNAALVRAVFDELTETRPAGFEYAVFYLRDQREFIHLYTETGNRSGLQQLASFQAFSADANTRQEQSARVIYPDLIGEYRSVDDISAHTIPGCDRGRWYDEPEEIDHATGTAS